MPAFTALDSLFLILSKYFFNHLYSVQFSCSAVSNSLWPHGLQHARLPCPSPNPRVYSNSCPSSWWCHPTTSSSVVPFSTHLQSFPALGSFQMSQFFASGGQSISFSFSISPCSDYSGLISLRMGWLEILLSKKLSSLLQHHSSKASILQRSALGNFKLKQQRNQNGHNLKHHTHQRQ